MNRLYAAAAIAAALPFAVFAAVPAKPLAAAPPTESTAQQTAPAHHAAKVERAS